MRRIGLLVEYEGTGYHGSQRQARQDTIEGRVREAAFALTNERSRLVSQGRTDAGVHAVGQVMALDTSTEHRPDVFVDGLNRFLPDDIAVKAAAELPEGFDVRRRVSCRQYRYLVFESATPAPLIRRWAMVSDARLDIEAMDEAAHGLLGEHDFASFASRPDRPTNPTRVMSRADVWRKRNIVEFVFEATAFLPHQVRRTVGALLEVGRGKMSGERFRSFLEAPAFATAGPSAPPQGLYLWRVRYEPPIFGEQP